MEFAVAMRVGIGLAMVFILYPFQKDKEWSSILDLKDNFSLIF